MAAAGAAILGVTPTLAAAPELAANVYYLRGTNIGTVPPDSQYEAFAQGMIAGSGGPTSNDFIKVNYPGGFWPVSKGYLNDPTYDASVQDGLDALNADAPGAGDIVFGYSQGAVVASQYKGENPSGTGATFVLVENPNRPNGGILERFNGLSIPILDVTFNGATPDNGDTTVDISRQYDGWSDFPTYPLNPLATTNALLGIVYLHGATQDITNPDTLSDLESPTPTAYYQVRGNTTYYLIPTERLPLLMPFTGIVPEPLLDAADKPLRYLVELGYDRTDYSQPTTAKLIPSLNPIEVATGFAEVSAESVADLAGGQPAAPGLAAKVAGTPAAQADSFPALPKPDLSTILPKPKTDAQQRTVLAKPTPTDNPVTAKPTVRNSPIAKPVQAALKALVPKNLTPKSIGLPSFGPKHAAPDTGSSSAAGDTDNGDS